MSAYYCDLLILIASLAGLIYGIVAFFLEKGPLYARMVTGAVGCMMLGRLSEVIRELAGFQDGTFHLNVLGYIGVFLFLFTANAGIMNGLADDGSKAFLKYRLIAFLAPLGIALVYLLIAFSNIPVSAKIIHGILAFFISLASYYHFKHALFPDVEFGVIRCIRGYNLVALAVCFLAVGELAAHAYDSSLLMLIISIPLAVCMLMILPVLKGGIAKWKI